MTSVLEVKEPFKIFVGDETLNKVFVGFPDSKKSNLKSGTSLQEMEYNGGDQIFPNYWEAWGRRVIDGKAPSDGTMVDITNTKYKGEIEFLESKDPNGQIIFCRYVRGQSSLDYDFQVNRLGLIKKELDEQNLLFTLARGEHQIEPNKDAAYALAIKVHPMNQNSKYKTSRYANYLYKETNVYETRKSNVRELDVDFEAKSIIKNNSSTFQKLKVLHTVFSEPNKEIKYDASDENSLYDALMLYADENPSEVIRLVKKYKEQTSNLIEKCKSYNFFDTTKNGFISVGLTKKEVLINDAEGKGENMLQWMFENSLEPKIFAAINTLHELAAKHLK